MRRGILRNVRIIAGTARGRRIVAPEGSRTRPTSDRVREAMFNALYSLDAIDELTFVDLFAGSGALGLEALSRGAASVVFVERDRAALTALRSNIDTLGFGDRSTVVDADAMRWIATAGHHEVVLADPPYDFESWELLLATVEADLVVVESSRTLDAVDPWRMLRERSYGSTVVTILSGDTIDG